MFKAILLSQWYNLSDIGLEEALHVRLDFILFTGFEVETEVPDHSPFVDSGIFSSTRDWTKFFLKRSMNNLKV